MRNISSIVFFHFSKKSIWYQSNQTDNSPLNDSAEISEQMNSSLINFFKDKRLFPSRVEDQSAKKKRRLTVPPGKSISLDDLSPKSDDQTDETEPAQSTSKSDIDRPFVLALPAIKEDDWLKVRIKSQKTNEYNTFVCNVMSTEGPDFLVKYVTPYKYYPDHYVWPVFDDISTIEIWQILKKLDSPTVVRRGVMHFKDL